jgi:hypothetical protein
MEQKEGGKSLDKFIANNAIEIFQIIVNKDKVHG